MLALFDAFAGVAKARLKDFIVKVLANTVWVVATAGRALPMLFDAFAQVAKIWLDGLQLSRGRKHTISYCCSRPCIGSVF